MKRLTIVSLVVLLSMVLAACGGAAKTAVPAAATKVAEVAPTVAAVATTAAEVKPTVAAAVEEKPFKVVVIGKSVHPYWSNVEKGVRACAKELGLKDDQAIFFVPPKEDVAAQTQTMETYIAQGATGIAIAPSDPNALEPVMKKAADAGIFVTTLDTPPVENSVSLVYIGTDNFSAGKSAGETMKALLPSGGKVGIGRGSDTALNALQRTDGFAEGIKGTQITTLEPVNDKEDAARALELANSVISANPDLAGAFGVYAYNGPAWATAIKEANKVGAIKLVSFDATTDIINGIKEGVIDATIAQREFDMGYKSCMLIYNMAKDGKDKAIADMGAVNGVIDTGVDVITGATLKDYEAGLDTKGIPHEWNTQGWEFKGAAAAAPVAAAASIGASAEGAASKGLTCLADAYNGKMKGTKVTMSGPFTDEDAVKFDNAMKEFEAATGIDIQYEGSKEFEASISARIQAGDPPDVIDFPQPGLLGTFAKQGKIVPATKLVPLDWLKENYNQSWLDMATLPGPAGTPDQYGVWERFNGKSLVWYPKKAFDDAGYKVPTTWEELQALQDQIVSDGDAPWCIGIESGAATGWPATDWTEDIMLRTTSLENYDKWVKGELKFDSPEVKKAIETFANTWNNDKMVYGGKAKIVTTFFGDAPTPMFEDPPKCWLHRQGNFITSFFPAGSQPGVDYDVFYLPGIDPQYGKPFLVAGDIMAASNERPETCAVMQFFSTGAGVKGWLAAGGALAMQNDSQLDWYGDPIEKKIAGMVKEATAFRFDASDLMPGAVGSGSEWKGFTDYFSGAADLDTVLKEIDAAWPK